MRGDAVLTHQKHICDDDQPTPLDSPEVLPSVFCVPREYVKALCDSESGRLLYIARHVASVEEAETALIHRDAFNFFERDLIQTKRRRLLIVDQKDSKWPALVAVIAILDIVIVMLALGFSQLELNTSQWVQYCLYTVLPDVIVVQSVLIDHVFAYTVAICALILNYLSVFVVLTNPLLVRYSIVVILILMLLSVRQHKISTAFPL